MEVIFVLRNLTESFNMKMLIAKTNLMRNIKFHAKLNNEADFLFLLLDGIIKILHSEATLKEKETDLKCYKVTVVSTLTVVKLGLRSLGMSAEFILLRCIKGFIRFYKMKTFVCERT